MKILVYGKMSMLIDHRFLKGNDLTITPNITLMSKLPVMDTLQGHPFDRHLSDISAACQ